MCVDDEPLMLQSLKDVLRRHFDVVTTTNGFEALRLLVEEPFDVLLSDMRMPMVHGARFLTMAREHAPDTVRLLLTGQSTLEDAVAAVNDGGVFRLLLKPCPPEELIASLEAAAERHDVLERRRRLTEQHVTGVAGALAGLAAATHPDARARAERGLAHASALVADAGGAAPSWELERACELVQLGAVGPDAPEDAAGMAARAAGHLERVPGLEAVAALMREASSAPEDGDGAPATEAAILRLALDHALALAAA